MKIRSKLTHLTLYSGILFSVLTVTVSSAAPVIDYGENLTALKKGFASGKVHILQIGDSHTAGDYFTEQLRKRLQAQIGDGGIGFAPPLKVRGQRVARHGYQNDGWILFTSKNDTANFPLGGFIAQPFQNNSLLKLTSEYYYGRKMPAFAQAYGTGVLKIQDAIGNRIYRINTNQTWQKVALGNIQFPASIRASGDVKIGGFWLHKTRGGIVSAMGINGSQVSQWNRWQNNLASDIGQSNAELVILAYGTNEAFSDDIENYQSALESAIKKIRRGLPHATILLVGAPESLKKKTNYCGQRPKYLDTVQYITQKTARTQQTLYWNWEDTMGGKCSMKRWMRQGLGNTDGVHFTRAGYEKAANDLYDSLMTTLYANPSSYTSQQPLLPHSNRLNPPLNSSQLKRSAIKKNANTSYQYEKKRLKPRGKICDASGCKYL